MTLYLTRTEADAIASRIVRNVMTPQFKAGDYDKGVTDGVNAIVAQLEGKGDLRSAQDESSSGSSSTGALQFNDPDLGWPERILLGAFIFGIIGLFTFVGVMTPGVGWFLYVFLIPFWAMFPIVVVGVRGAMILLGVYVVGYPIAKLILGRTAWYQKAAQDLETKGTASVGGFVMGSGGSSGSSSSGEVSRAAVGAQAAAVRGAGESFLRPRGRTVTGDAAIGATPCELATAQARALIAKPRPLLRGHAGASTRTSR